MGDLPESVASGSNTFSQKIGTAGAYDSDTLWSAGVALDFSTGIGRGLADGGIYYSEVDTRRPDAILPPLARASKLPHVALGSSDPSPLANRCHFAEADQRLFMAFGDKLYEWSEGQQSFHQKLYLGMYATSVAFFDGYLHIAGYRDDTTVPATTPPERDYLWVRVDDFSYGFDVLIISHPLLFHVFGGLLYAAQGNNLYYTAGSQQEDTDTGYPPAPWNWEWVGPIRIGSYGDAITGIAGVIYQQLGQRYVYVSTQSWLNVLLPGDIPFGVTAWPMTDSRNGAGMKSFYNRVYIPVGGDLFALQSNGDLIASGIDSSSEGLPLSIAGEHFDIATSANFPFVTMRGDRSTVWAGKASSWHFMGKLPVGEDVAGSWYSNVFGRLFVGSDTGLMTHYYLGNTNRPPRYDTAYRYATRGIIDTGWYTGALFEQPKYWHSAFVDANDLTEDNSVELVYLSDEEANSFEDIPDYTDWHSLGVVSRDQQELTFGYQLSSKRVRVAAILRTTDPTRTPAIRSIGIRYTPKLIDRNRWSITVKLPKWEQYDAAGALVEDYDQAAQDTQLDSLRKRTAPVLFKDLDDQYYWVLVTGASRRIHSVGNDDGLSYDVDWSFALTEVGKLTEEEGHAISAGQTEG